MADLDPMLLAANGRWPTTRCAPAGPSCSASWCAIRYLPDRSARRVQAGETTTCLTSAM